MIPVPSTWLSWATSKSPARSFISRAMRELKVLGSGHPERVGLAVEVEARHLGEHDPLVEVGVGLAGEHLHLVPEPDELAAEVADVDALTAAVRLAAVGQHGDAHCGLPFVALRECPIMPTRR